MRSSFSGLLKLNFMVCYMQAKDIRQGQEKLTELYKANSDWHSLQFVSKEI